MIVKQTACILLENSSEGLVDELALDTHAFVETQVESGVLVDKALPFLSQGILDFVDMLRYEGVVKGFKTGHSLHRFSLEKLEEKVIQLKELIMVPDG